MSAVGVNMPYKFNPFTDNMDLVGKSLVYTGTSPINVTGTVITFDFSTNNTWTGTNEFQDDFTINLSADECVEIIKPADIGGTCHPLTITGGWKLPIAQTQIFMRNNETDNSTQLFGFTARSYDVDANPISVLVGQAGASANLLLWGGSANQINGPTTQSFSLHSSVSSATDIVVHYLGFDANGDINNVVPNASGRIGKFGLNNVASPRPTFYCPTASIAWIDTNDFSAVNLKIGDGNGDGTGADYMIIESDGDVAFYGGSGLPFGHMYGKNISQAVSILSANVAYEITAGATAGNLHNVTFGGNHYLQVTYEGHYKVEYNVSLDTNTANDEIEIGVMINGTEATTDGGAHGTVSSANKSINLSGTCILDLASTNQVSLYVRNHTAARSVTVEHLNLSLVQIGGT